MSTRDFHYCGPACDPPHRGEEWPTDWEAKIRADERGQWVQRWIADSERQRAKIEAIAAYSTFGPDGSLDGADVVLRSDVLALFPEEASE